MVRPATLVIALVLAAPTVWQVFSGEDFDLNRALSRYLIAVPVAAAMVFGLSLLTESYRRAADARAEAELEAELRDERAAANAGTGTDTADAAEDEAVSAA